MKRKMKPIQIVVVASCALLLAACGSSSNGRSVGGDGGAGGDGGVWGTGGDGGTGATDGTGGTGGGGTGGTGGGVDPNACLEMCDHVYKTCNSSLDRTYGRCQFDCKNGLISEELLNCASGACATIPSCTSGGAGGSGGDPGTGGTGGDPGTGGTGGDPGTGGTGATGGTGGGPKPPPSAACMAACNRVEKQCRGAGDNLVQECAEDCRDDKWPSRSTTCLAGLPCTASSTDADLIVHFEACFNIPTLAQCQSMCGNVYQCDSAYYELNGTPVSLAQCPALCREHLSRDTAFCNMVVPIPANPTKDYCFEPTANPGVAGLLHWCENGWASDGDPAPRAECTQVCLAAHTTPEKPGDLGCNYTFPDRAGGTGYLDCMMNCEAFDQTPAKQPWSDEYLICMRNAMYYNNCTGMAACAGK